MMSSNSLRLSQHVWCSLTTMFNDCLRHFLEVLSRNASMAPLTELTRNRDGRLVSRFVVDFDGGGHAPPAPATSDATTSSSSSSSSNADTLSPIQIEQRKREMLSKQLGRSFASVSGPELDAMRVVRWQDLPACPIGGMHLAEQGMWDSDIGRFLTSDDMRELINNTGKLEAVTNISADTRLTGTAMNRIFDLGFTAGRYTAIGVMFWFWGVKLPNAYVNAFPRRSVFVKYYYDRWRGMENQALELLCQENKRFFNATNPRVLAFALFGSWGLIFGALGEYAKNIPSLYKETSQMATLQNQHFESTMKWLFAVYYHHPAYEADAAAKTSRGIRINPPTDTPRMKPTPNLDSRRSEYAQRHPNR